MTHEVKLGSLIEGNAGRDAVHVAVAPVQADEELPPGEHVGLRANGRASFHAPHIGIVDPYLREPVQPGQRFWLCLYPNSVVSLRHVWQHPSFAPKAT